MNLELSNLDSLRFDITVAKANSFTHDDLDHINLFCVTHNVRLLIARVSTDDIFVAQKMESLGYKLTDTLVYYKYDYTKKQSPQYTHTNRIINISGNEEYACEVLEIAKQSFKGYFGHYHADPKLEVSKSDAIYVDWAYRSCMNSQVADAVMAAFFDEKIVGFVTLKIRSESLGELILSGVSPLYQKRGLYQSLIYSGMEWLHGNNLNQIILSTQLNNISVQKVWARLGFEMDHSYYTFHKWFDQ